MNADSSKAITQSKHEHLDLSLPQDAYVTMKNILEQSEGKVAEVLRNGLSSYNLSARDEKPRSPNLSNSVNKIYRFYLPAPATNEQFIEFRQNVELMRRANPKWEISPELPKSGEEEAVVMMYKGDGNYLSRQAAYVINQSLSSFFQGSYDGY
jgi:hypothetical protein